MQVNLNAEFHHIVDFKFSYAKKVSQHNDVMGVLLLAKTGIITINSYVNYGNRLQNYATQEVMKSVGFEAENIVNVFESNKKLNLRNIMGLLIKHYNKITNRAYDLEAINVLLHKRLQRIKFFVYERIYKDLHEQKRIAFKKFTTNNIKETSYIISKDNIPEKLADHYDYFVVGSDQVWNPHFERTSSLDFLVFAPKEKRISYSASFGVSSIPGELIEQYSEWLKGMTHISVREESGAKIVKELTGRSAEVLVDPTLMLSKEQWLSVSKPAKSKPEKNYAFTYFLGTRHPAVNRWINKACSDNNLDLVELSSWSDRERFAACPGEFLDYINSSSVVFTDSFHGTVFSIIFEKPFVVFEKSDLLHSMYSRMDTLLAKFKLEDRKWENIKSEEDIFKCSFSHIKPILSEEKQRSLEYLMKALNVSQN